MIKRIEYDNELIGLVLISSADSELKPGINFLTNPSEPLQVGILNHPGNHEIKAHFHNSIEKKIIETQEMLYVESGKMRVDFYNSAREKIAEEVLKSGDLVVLLRGGHGMEMLEDSKIVYCKQGPYTNKLEDKTIL